MSAFDAVFHVPAVEVIDVVEQFAGAVGIRRLVLVGVDEVEHGAGTVEDVALHGAGVVELEILRQVAGDEFAAAHDVARVGFGDAGGDAQERRFARAVASDQPDAVALVDGEGGFVEDRVHAVADFEFVDAQDGVARCGVCHGKGESACKPTNCRRFLLCNAERSA